MDLLTLVALVPVFAVVLAVGGNVGRFLGSLGCVLISHVRLLG